MMLNIQEYRSLRDTCTCRRLRFIDWIIQSRVMEHESLDKGGLKSDTGYPHDSRADKDSYPHDGRADKDSYPHDRHN